MTPDLSRVTVFRCPLSKCAWTHDSSPGPGEDPRALASVFGPGVFAAIAAQQRMAETEAAIQAHLSGHALIEWVTEVVNLHDVMTSVAAELDERGRIGHSLLTGAMATRANLAREECIERIGHAIKGDSDE